MHQVKSEVICGDSTTLDFREALQPYGLKSVQMAMMHPPYFDIIKFSDDSRDLSNASSIEGFLEKMGIIVKNTAQVLDRGRYLCSSLVINT